MAPHALTRRELLGGALTLAALPWASACAPLPRGASTGRAWEHRALRRALGPGLHVGAASVEITPVALDHLYLAGGRPDRRPVEVRDRLYARAVYFDDGVRAWVWVVADVLGFGRSSTLRIRRAVEGVDVALSGTGTWDAPDLIGAWEPGLFASARPSRAVVELVDHVEHAALTAIERAAESASACEIHVGRARAEKGDVAREVTAVEAKTVAGTQLVATLLFVPWLPSILGSWSTVISAGVPGAVRDLMESTTRGAPCLVIPGAACDWPVASGADRRTREAELERAGRWLANAGLAARAAARRSADQRARLVVRPITSADVESEVALALLGDVVALLLPTRPSPSFGAPLAQEIGPRAADLVLAGSTGDLIGPPDAGISGLPWPSDGMESRLKDALEALARETKVIP